MDWDGGNYSGADIFNDEHLLVPIKKRLHALIIPKRHVLDHFELYQPERNAVQQLLESQRLEVMNADMSITGFNVGNNVGETAGQTVMHCHTHLIPCRTGDVDNPAGGIRGVIADKQKY